jgi:spore coat polysaccharide biosynthesis predicted glycosyltransferase SpsG
MFSSLYIWAEAHHHAGYGHVRRTLAVAQKIKEYHPTEVIYLQQENADATLIKRTGFRVEILRDHTPEAILEKCDVKRGPVLLDNYVLSERYLEALGDAGAVSVVFDDGCRLDHYRAAAVVDSAPNAPTLPYTGAAHTRFCLGPEYFPLRKEFCAVNKRTPDRTKINLLVTCGGSDPDDVTALIVRALDPFTGLCGIAIVLGPAYQGAISDGDTDNWTVIRNTTDMAGLMAQSDIIITAAGGTAMEAAAMGKPALLAVLSPDQKHIAQALSDAGSAVSLGVPDALFGAKLARHLRVLAGNTAARRSMSEAGRRLIDGQGVERIARTVMECWELRDESH